MVSDDGMVLMRVLTVVARDIDFNLFKNREFKNALKHLMDNYSTEDIDKAFAVIDAERTSTWVKADDTNKILQEARQAGDSAA
jgi:hypothetical protein